MRIMVTGGAGFIGSHVAEAFSDAGHEVLAIDNLSRGKLANLVSGIGFEQVDVRDYEKLGLVMEKFRPQVVSHQAAQVSVRESVADPVFDAEVNVLGSLKLLELSARLKVEYFMFASTGGAIYGEQDVFPAPEDHPARPLSPYAVSKLAVERYLFFYEKTHGLAYAALRYANVYGPRQDPHGEAGVVAIFARKMLAGETPTINGDGGQTRDFVYVKDVARASLLAFKAGFRGAANIGTGKETDVNTIFRAIKKAAGARAEAAHGPAMPGEQRRSVLDPSYAGRAFGWSAEVDLARGIEETVDYFRE